MTASLRDVSFVDHQAICETIYTYAYGIDLRDWARYRSIFADRVAIDFTSYNPSRPAAVTEADAWVRSVQPLFGGLAATQHSMSNPIVEVRRGPERTADRATCTMYMQALHVLDATTDSRWFDLGGYYTDTLVRTAEGGWLIDGVTLTVLWRRGDESIMAEAVRRSAGER